jgi:predicted nucleic-acid-binding Zn-ribbon protein
MALTKSEFVRFLAGTKIPGRKCPHCGNAGYAVNVDTPEDNVSGHPAPFHIHVPEVGSHEFYSAACTNCGRTDFHHINQIDKWLAANPRPES